MADSGSCPGSVDLGSGAFPPWLIVSLHEQPALCLLGFGERSQGGDVVSEGGLYSSK